MDQQDELDFEDAALKDAVRRAWASERGPARLRGRVSHLIATAGSIDDVSTVKATSRASAEIWRSRMYTLAAAAVILFAIGLLVLQYQGVFEPRLPFAQATPPPAQSIDTPVPDALAGSLVARHDGCASMRDHYLVQHPGVKSYGALNVQLTADLGFPVLARGIGSEWRFKGAGTCEVGPQRASHLLFSRGNQSVSLFSLPATCAGGPPNGSVFQGMVNDHPVAGFSRNGGVYAVVGSAAGGASLSVDTVSAIRNSLMGLFEPGGCTGDTTGAEFLE